MQTRPPPPAVLCIIAAVAAASTAAGQAVAPSADLAALETMAPRPAGSAAEIEVMRYVEARLQALAVPHAVHPSGAVVASVPGRYDQTLALVVPLDHAPHAVAGHDGSTAIAAALHVVERAARNRLPLSLQAVFVSGDHGARASTAPDSAALAAGSAVLAASGVLHEAAVVVYLNMPAIPDRLVLRTDGLAMQTPRWLLEAAADAIDHTGLPFTARSTANQLARIGLPLQPSMADPYLASDYPAIELAGRYSGTRTAAVDAWVEDFATVIEALHPRVASASGDEWERHYLFVRIGELRLTLDEIGVIASVATALALALALAVLVPRRLHPYRRLLLRHAWLLPIAAVAVYVALTTATALLAALLAVRDLPSLWQRLPGPALAFKGTTALLLVMVAAKVLAQAAAAWRTHTLHGGAAPEPDPDPAQRRRPEAGALSAGAAALLPAVVAAVTAIDPTASLPFVCAYAGSLLFCLARLRAAKVIWLAVSVAAPAAAVADLIGAGADGLLESLLVSSMTGNALLTLALLPFVLMALRLTLRPSEPLAAWGARRRLRRSILTMALISTAAGLTLVAFPSDPPVETVRRAQPVGETLQSRGQPGSLALAALTPERSSRPCRGSATCPAGDRPPGAMRTDRSARGAW